MHTWRARSHSDYAGRQQEGSDSFLARSACSSIFPKHEKRHLKENLKTNLDVENVVLCTTSQNIKLKIPYRFGG
jgi:hypothetical protein